MEPTAQPTLNEEPTATPEPAAAAAPGAASPAAGEPQPVMIAVPEATADPARLAEGIAVYRKQYCGICHVLSVIPTTGTFGPTHDGVGSRALERIADPGYTGTATTAAEYLRESLVDPHAYIVPGAASGAHPMPDYSFLSDAELDALVDLLLAQR